MSWKEWLKGIVDNMKEYNSLFERVRSLKHQQKRTKKIRHLPEEQVLNIKIKKMRKKIWERNNRKRAIRIQRLGLK